MRSDLITIPKVQVAFACNMIDVKAKLELIDPIKTTGARVLGADPIAIDECSVVPMFETPSSRIVGVTDSPLMRPGHESPRWKGAERPSRLLLHVAKILRCPDIVFVRVGCFACSSNE